MLEYVILGLLIYRPMTGYDFEQRMTQIMPHIWVSKLSQIYTTLKKQEQRGEVTSVIEEQPHRPNRRIYSITDKGRAVFKQWLAQPQTELDYIKAPFLLRVFFAAQGDRDLLLTQLRVHRDMHQQRLENFDHDFSALIESADNKNVTADDKFYWKTVRQFGTDYELMYIDWLDNLIKELEGN